MKYGFFFFAIISFGFIARCWRFGLYMITYFVQEGRNCTDIGVLLCGTCSVPHVTKDVDVTYQIITQLKRQGGERASSNQKI